MDLWLWRHAEAEPGEPDLARPLTPKGRRQAERMARWLARRLPGDCRILVSPAVRAQQTAKALGRPFATLGALAPAASAADVLAATGWPDAEGALVVGHQPTLGEVAALLVCGEAQPWPVRKGAVWWLAARRRGLARDVVVRAVVAPDLLEV